MKEGREEEKEEKNSRRKEGRKKEDIESEKGRMMRTKMKEGRKGGKKNGRRGKKVMIDEQLTLPYPAAKPVPVSQKEGRRA